MPIGLVTRRQPLFSQLSADKLQENIFTFIIKRNSVSEDGPTCTREVQAMGLSIHSYTNTLTCAHVRIHCSSWLAASPLLNDTHLSLIKSSALHFIFAYVCMAMTSFQKQTFSEKISFVSQKPSFFFKIVFIQCMHVWTT